MQAGSYNLIFFIFVAILTISMVAFIFIEGKKIEEQKALKKQKNQDVKK